ncbi:hypothetical protein ANCDUO_09755 [Ancylostoma duodenale]|uniref:Lipid-binding serum glycoprotein N-terminal domain-containing protein n=1 Tax=Ancylostoma duodenale TaxID=51022 RepID=A0A0C2GSG7_9BILA|nr:hypothetical protein ANCDUO_09755 [Ancylostoma duodenale]
MYGIRKMRELVPGSCSCSLISSTSTMVSIHFYKQNIPSAKGINFYLQSFGKEYEKELENHGIPTITKKRCLGTVELTEITVTDVTVESTMDVIVESDHYLRLSIRDLNATLGPLLPVNIGGIPYLNQEISCSISHTEDKIIARGGILRWLAKKRLKDTMKEDLEGILCDSLVDILDVKIRKSLANLSLLLPVNEAITVSYLLSRQPFLLPHGAIRTYHLGVTSKHHIGENFYPTTIESDHDVIYHIHEALLSEITDSVCKQRYMDGNFTNEGNQVRMICQKASISVKNLEDIYDIIGSNAFSRQSATSDTNWRAY